MRKIEFPFSEDPLQQFRCELRTLVQGEINDNPAALLHKLTIYGPPDQLRAILEQYFEEQSGPDDGELVLSFEKILPSPKEFADFPVDGMYYPTERMARQYIEGALESGFLLKWFDLSPEECPGKVSVSQIVQLVAQKYPDRWEEFTEGVSAYKKLGYASQYTWRWENWGVEWPAFGGKVEVYPEQGEEQEELVCYFKTIEEIPWKIVEALSARYPNCVFHMYSLWGVEFASYIDIGNGAIYEIIQYEELHAVEQIAEQIFGITKEGALRRKGRKLSSLVFES